MRRPRPTDRCAALGYEERSTLTNVEIPAPALPRLRRILAARQQTPVSSVRDTVQRAITLDEKKTQPPLTYPPSQTSSKNSSRSSV